MAYMVNGRSIAKNPEKKPEVELKNNKGKTVPEKLPESKTVDLKESMARRLQK